MGFSLIFDQPNLDDQSQGHLYFAAGNGQTITVFTDESRKPSGSFLKDQIGAVHHLAFSVSRVVLTQVSERLKERGIKHTPVKDRGFMNSIYFHDPLGLRVELAVTGLNRQKGQRMPTFLPRRTACGWKTAKKLALRCAS